MSWHDSAESDKLHSVRRLKSPRSRQDAMDPHHRPASATFRRGRFALLGLVVTLLAASCAEGRLDYTQPVGENAKDINFLTSLSGIMAIVVGLIIAVLVVLVVVKFRSRPETYDELPEQIHGNTKAELTWTAIPAAMLVVLAGFTVPLILDLAEEGDGMTVRVEGQQWWWQFSYDIDEDGEYDIVTANEIVFPIDEEVNLEITSNDVIHSFWVPELNGKRDAVPGRVHPWRISSPEPGIFWGECTEFCGLSHANMQIRAVALERADFDAWVQSQLEVADLPTDPNSPEGRGRDLFAQQCIVCHTIDTADDSLISAAPEASLRAGVAPNLTHLMSRTTFAGSLFDLYNDDGSVNVADLREWVRDAPAMKPMHPDNLQGMKSFADVLNEEDLDDIVAFLQTLGDPPPLPRS